MPSIVLPCLQNQQGYENYHVSATDYTSIFDNIDVGFVSCRSFASSRAIRALDEPFSTANMSPSHGSLDEKAVHTASTALDFQASTPEASLGAPLQNTDSTASDPYGSRPRCFPNLLSECLFVVTTAFAIGMNGMLNGALITMTVAIQEDLNMNSSEVTWLIAGMGLTSGAALLFFGRVADLFGRRPLLIYSMAAFTICMLITGFSKNALMAEVFLALSGIACASVVPPAIGKLGAIYEKPSRRKNRAFACFSAGNPVGFVLGAIASGLLTKISWRASFWGLAVIYGFFTVAAWFTTPQDTEQTLGGLNWETMKQMDWIGAILALAGIGLFTAAFTLAPEANEGWKTGYVLAMLIIGFFLMAVFLYWQSVFKYPLMPLHVWRDRNFSLLVLILSLTLYGFSGNFFWQTLAYQRVFHDSSLEVAVKLLPAALGGMLVNLLAALIMHRISNKLLFIMAALSAVVSNALLSATSKTISWWALFFPSQLFAVLSIDIMFCVTNMYVMSSLPSEQQSVAGGMFQTVTRLATTVGLGVATTVFAETGGSTEVSESVPWLPYQATFWVSLVGAVLGLILTPFLTIGKQGHRQKSNAHVEDQSQQTEKS